MSVILTVRASTCFGMILIGGLSIPGLRSPLPAPLPSACRAWRGSRSVFPGSLALSGSDVGNDLRPPRLVANHGPLRQLCLAAHWVKGLQHLSKADFAPTLQRQPAAAQDLAALS